MFKVEFGWIRGPSGVPNAEVIPMAMLLNQLICLAQFDPYQGREGRSLSYSGPEGRHCSYFIHSDQLFLSHGGPNKSKQCLSLWIVDVNTHIYWTRNHLVPPSVRCQSTRNVDTLWAALRGMPLVDICPKDS